MSTEPHQTSNELPQRHSNWWKRVPAALTLEQEIWKGAAPTGSDDPRWQAYQARRLEHRERVISELRQLWNLDPPASADDVHFWRSMAVNLLELFPALEVIRETRGKKRQRKLFEPESIARRKRRISGGR